MITCMPIRMWIDHRADEQQHEDARPAASRGSAPPRRDCGRAATTTMTTKAMISGTLATAVSRWRQKCPVPSWAEPRPRTRRAACACCRVMRLPSQVADDPERRTVSADRADERRTASQRRARSARGRRRCPRPDGGCRRACGGRAPRCSRTASAARATSREAVERAHRRRAGRRPRSATRRAAACRHRAPRR